MNKKLYTLLLLPLLFSCGQSGPTGPVETPDDYVPEEKHYYAMFMYNYPRMEATSPSGNPELVENLLYYKQEIQLDTPFNKPTDPSREKFNFVGWFKEKDCEHEWNFTVDAAKGSVFLYAKWDAIQEEDEDEYVEPEYVYPETIITDTDYRVTGILNSPVSGDSVNLTKGAIVRLTEHKEDVSFAVNYERREDAKLTVATYDDSLKKIHLETNTGKTFDITVNDITESKRIESNKYYEEKADKYETNGGDIENYHICLGGSSSMENWSESAQDMAPIVTFNHGIGGTSAEEWADSLFERLVMPYSPKAVVYYVGVNDIINRGKTGSQTATYLNNLFDKTHQYLPNTHIFYVLINKLPNYLNKQSQFDIANSSANNYAASHDYLTCIDAGKGLLKPNKLPDSSYFLGDGLHMTLAGYAIWGKAVKEAIINWLG